MTTLPFWRRYARFFGADPAADVSEEIGFHLEAKTEDLIRQGWTPEAARKEAERQFGDCDGIGARSIHDRNPLAGSGIDVNIVHSHAGPADHAQLGGVLKQCFIDLHSRTHN